MIKLLYFSSETLIPSPTLAKAADGAMHGAKDEPQATGSRPHGPAGGAGNNKKISAPKTGINTKKQTFIKNVSKSDQFD